MPKKSARRVTPRAKARSKRTAARPAPERAPATKPAPTPVEVKHFPKRKLNAVSPPAPAARPAPKPAPAQAEPKAEAPSRKALPAGDDGKTFPIEIDPKRVEETLQKIRGELSHWAKKGRYTKVRFKFRGKQLLPDLPLVAVAAVEGLTFYWGGILRALIFNVAGKTVFDVELVNDSEKRVQAGREALLSGDADKALALFKEALDMDRDNPNVHLNLGIVLKLKGDLAAARQSLEKAKSLDALGPYGAEAEKILLTFPKAGSQTVVTVQG